MAVLFLASCNDETDLGVTPEGDGNSILINLSSETLPVGRAALDDNATESAVHHIDVLIFADDGSKKWHERIVCNSATNTISLSAKRSDFTADTPYWVYLIANSTAEATAFADKDFNLDKLRSMTQTDERIHVTGLSFEGVETPKNFLMDGVAYLESDKTEPASASAVVLNNGNKADDTKLKVTLRRAAAKIVVKIYKGEKVTFKDKFVDGETTTTVNPGYYLRNLPFTTSVIAGVDGESELRTTTETATSYFEWSESAVTVTAYAYAHSWENLSALEKEPRLIVNIPMTYTDGDGNSTDHQSNYYQIPVCRGSELKRNTCYTVTVTLNIPGATKPSNPVELKSIEYNVEDWITNTINIGGESDRPTYLTLNRSEMEMHNIDSDHTTLQFASSSNVSANVTEAYYFDKFGQKKNVSDEILQQIKITPDPGLSGKITVYSPVPTNNTIRYIKVTFTNADNISRTVTIEQYPLEYITNTQGWYSYRSDFGGTTWELLNGKDVSGTTFNQNNRIQQRYVSCKWEITWDNDKKDYIYDWTYSNEYSSGFFRSKVATQIETGTNEGMSMIDYYKWDETFQGKGKNMTYSYSTNHSKSYRNPGNARMYHVHITASSSTYTLGLPKIKDGKTDSGDDNALLVSPSFMIASQLGAVSTTNDIDVAAKHCEQYVEVYKDKETNQIIHLNDWRLPTKAEVEIILKFQYKKNAAMDEVLAGKWYWSASGSVYNSSGEDGTETEAYIRCIRDAYDDKTPADK